MSRIETKRKYKICISGNKNNGYDYGSRKHNRLVVGLDKNHINMHFHCTY